MILPIIIIGAIAFVLYYLFSHFAGGSAEDQKKVDLDIPVVTVAKVTQELVVDRIPVTGSFVAKNNVLVSSEINGFAVETVNVDVGDKVVKGDVLASVNKDTLTAQYAQALSQVEALGASKNQANSALNRTEKLKAGGVQPQSALDQAKSAAANANGASVQARAALDIAEFNLENSQITAPVTGIIATRNLEQGSIASSASGPVFTIIEDGKIEMEAEVVETDLSKLKLNNEAEIDINAAQPIKGRLRLISPTVDEQTRIGLVRIEFDSSDNLRVGAFASGWITISSHDANVVPVTAVISTSDRTYVQTVDKDGIVKAQDVVAGIISNGKREIISGLTPGQTVLAKAGAFFRNGDKVTAKDDATKDAVKTEIAQ